MLPGYALYAVRLPASSSSSSAAGSRPADRAKLGVLEANPAGDALQRIRLVTRLSASSLSSSDTPRGDQTPPGSTGEHGERSRSR